MQQVISSSGEDEQLPLLLRWQSLLIILIGLTIIRLVTASWIGLSNDEAYYRLWSIYPTIGYFDHPPMIAWWIALGREIVGDNILGIRLIGVISVLVGSLVLWHMAATLYDKYTSGITVLLYNAILMIGIGTIFAIPDAPSVLFWTLSMWALVMFHKSRNEYWWLVVGIFTGCGLLSKYTGFFLGIGIVAWVIWNPSLRYLLKSWQLWLGGILSTLIFSPVIIWNLNNDLASFSKQFGRLVPRDWTIHHLFEYFGFTAVLVNPLMLYFLVPSVYLLMKNTFKSQKPLDSLLFFSLAPLFVYLAFHSFHSEVQFNWHAPLMAVFALVSASYAEGYRNGIQIKGRSRRAWSGLTIIVGLIAVFLIYIHAYNQLFGEYGRRDPISRLQGWEQVGKDLEKLAIKYDTKWIATTSYSYTSLISFELRDKIPVIQLTERIRYSMAPEPEESLTGQPGLYVTLLRRDLTHYIKGRFGKFVKVAKLERKVRDTVLDDIVVYYFEEPIENPIGDIDYEAFVSTNLPLSISTNFRNQQPRAYGLNSLTPYTGLNLMEYQVF